MYPPSYQIFNQMYTLLIFSTTYVNLKMEPRESSIKNSYYMTRLIKHFAGFGKMQYVFLVLFLLMFPLLVPFLKEFNSIVEMRKRVNPAYNWPEYDQL